MELDNKYCSPKKFRYATKYNTCFTKKELQEIAKDYNNTQSQDTSGSKHPYIKINQPKQVLYESIKTALEDRCADKEYCWADQAFLRSQTKGVLTHSLRPVKPEEWYQNPRTWLNTFNILDVMKQYEYYQRKFVFLGVYPLDFQNKYSSGSCIGDYKIQKEHHNMCSFHINDVLNNKKTHFAEVLNLDYHHQSGSHWVAVYCNLDPKKPNFGIYYYDSVADDIPHEVQTFMDNVHKQVMEVFKPEISAKFEKKRNQIQKQFKNTECGMFTMVFLTRIIEYNLFADICRDIPNDDRVNQIRNIFYRPNLKVQSIKPAS